MLKQVILFRCRSNAYVGGDILHIGINSISLLDGGGPPVISQLLKGYKKIIESQRSDGTGK